MHVLYCALSSDDFILEDEFRAISEKLHSFTITYRPTNGHGLLSEEEIITLVKSFHEPDIYICGPEGFTNLIQQTLEKINYFPQKVYIEKFVPV